MRDNPTVFITTSKMLDEIAWKCSVAFLLGAATHYVLTSYTQSGSQSVEPSALASVASKGPVERKKSTENEGADGLDGDVSSDEDWEGVDEPTWEPHKMVLCVRTDLKMGKGKIAAQCCHATLGAYKRAIKRTPNAVKAWEMLGQAKVCLKVDSEEEMMSLAQTAAEIGLVHYVVVDAGRTQIAPDSKTVLSIGPAPIEAINAVTGHLKLIIGKTFS